MSRTEFGAAFPATETSLIERKTGISRGPLADSIVAFSNTEGGVILIGVDDAGQVTGRELTQGLEDDIHEVMSNIRDPGRYTLHPLRVDGTAITVLAVAKRSEGFSQTSNGRVLVRRGTRDEALFGPALRDFLNARSLERFETTDIGLPLSDAPKALVSGLAAAFGWSGAGTYPERMAEHGLAVHVRSGYHLTVAGALHVLPSPGDKLGKTYIEILRFREGASNYDRRVEIDGPLRDQVEGATEFVLDELGTELVILGIHRHELPRIPERVLREAIANAVAHRSYELRGTPVRIEIRPDAVIITSPGGLPEPVTVENMRDQAAARNGNVIRVLRAFKLAEDSGAGVDVMQDLMREELLDPPTFADSGTAVTVTLPIRSAVAPSERAWVREVEQRGLIETSDRIVLVHAARGEVLTNARVRELLAVDKDTARAALQRLRDAGFLVQRGRRGGATYILDRSLQPPAGLRLGRAELEDLVFEMASEGPLSNAEVRARTGLDRPQALQLLSRLVAEGRLTRLGERRGTRYVAINGADGAPRRLTSSP
jgi:ATP-dependent DNA helicase RecG